MAPGKIMEILFSEEFGSMETSVLKSKRERLSVILEYQFLIKGKFESSLESDYYKRVKERKKKS